MDMEHIRLNSKAWQSLCPLSACLHLAATSSEQVAGPNSLRDCSQGGLERRASSGGPRAMSMSRSPSRDGSSQPEGRALPGTSSLGFRAGAASTFGASGSGAGEELPRKSKLPAAKGSVGQQQQPKLEAVAEEQAKGERCANCDCPPGCGEHFKAMWGCSSTPILE